MSLSDYLIGYYAKCYYHIISKCVYFYYLDILSYIPFTRRLIAKKYTDYQIKTIINHQYALSMSGINMGYE